MTRVSSYDLMSRDSVNSTRSSFTYLDKYNQRYADTCDYDRDLHLTRSVYQRQRKHSAW